MSAYLNFQALQSAIDKLTTVQKTALRDTLSISSEISSVDIDKQEQLDLMIKAMSGDMVIVCTPAELDTEESALADRSVAISIETAEGEVHTWLNATFSGAAAIAEGTAGNGVALLDEVDATTADVVFANGQARVDIYISLTWAAVDTNTLTVGGTSSITIMGKALTEATSVETVVADPE